ncbi:hypothetical protein EJ05DRAFT_486157 [Pseudovirgaria hyperparasitica]|uniref:Protein kinase domain-containing protein n=1 Tax=Pseudovirgaria hyperparasitica TaxID=470096 RepID=A0A6A6W821_9PEZI|nr:uncharacterized protein EJ05DRAFT_486157 [Pseudovirgaria hyperparasitica]KAF2758100.1 hypothetical protein EJ05DRAFT_486157 [Pseudovirgaria hyperparasitica]
MATNIKEYTFEGGTPYTIGSCITLRIQGTSKSVECKIVKHLECSHACTMVVRLTLPRTNYEAHYVLKVFDRRFTFQRRYCVALEPWVNGADEQAYQEFVLSGQAKHLVDHKLTDWYSWYDLKDDDDGKYFEHSDDPRSTIPGADDARVQWWCRHERYNTETNAYKLMQKHQGEIIPRIHALVTVRNSCLWGQVPTEYSDSVNLAFQAPGLLMEYIGGFKISDIQHHVSIEHYQQIMDGATSVFEQTQACGVCHQEVNCVDMLVRPKLSSSSAKTVTYQTVYVDWSDTKFREPTDSDAGWSQIVYEASEADSIGLAMLGVVKPHARYMRTQECQDREDIHAHEHWCKTCLQTHEQSLASWACSGFDHWSLHSSRALREENAAKRTAGLE